VAFGTITLNSATTIGNNYNVIYNNDITNAPSQSQSIGIYNIGTAGIASTGNIIAGNRFMNFNAYGYTDGNGGSAGYSVNTVIKGNEFFNSAAVAATLYAIQPESNNISNMVIANNNIHNLNVTTNSYAIYGIDLNQASSVSAYNNMINLSDTKAAPLVGINDRLASGSGANVYFNTVSIGGSSATGNSACYWKTGTSTTSQLKNNILVNARTGSAGTNKQYIIAIAGGTLASSYNDLWTNGGTGSFFGLKGGTDITNFTNWQAASQDVTGSLNIQPVFVSAADLHLDNAFNTAIDNKGTVISGITTDYDFDIRSSSTPDMGADEFNAPIAENRYWASTNDWNNNLINWSNVSGGPYNQAIWAKDYTAWLEKYSGTITISAPVSADGMKVARTQTAFPNLTFTLQSLNAANYVTLTPSVLIDIAGGSQLTLGGSIPVLTSANGINKTGGGLLLINQPVRSDFTGTVLIDSGTVQLNTTASNAFPASTNVDVFNVGKLQISSNQTLNSINMYNGTLQVDAGKTLTVNGNLTLVNGAITGAGSIVYAAGAKLIYAGNGRSEYAANRNFKC